MSQQKQVAGKPPVTFVVEHLDPELGPWSALEYRCIAEESRADGAGFMLTSVPESLRLPANLESLDSLQVERRSVEEVFAGQKDRVCLLDPGASADLSPEDGKQFDCFLFGGILGDDPPRDRTAELRRKRYASRRLGSKQMTTDTAVRVSRMVVRNEVPLDKIPYIDFPELRLNQHESTQMPFRYVRGEDEKPVMPEGMVDLIQKDADKGLDDLF